MKANREKTSSVMGLVVSVLLHAIFFAGCFALDATLSVKSSITDTQATQNLPLVDQADHAKPKS